MSKLLKKRDKLLIKRADLMGKYHLNKITAEEYLSLVDTNKKLDKLRLVCEKEYLKVISTMSIAEQHAKLIQAFDAGFAYCARDWANREDLVHDMTSPAYKQDRKVILNVRGFNK